MTRSSPLQSFLETQLAERQRLSEERRRRAFGHLKIFTGPSDSGKSLELASEFWTVHKLEINTQFFRWTYRRNDSGPAERVQHLPDQTRIETVTDVADLYSRVRPETQVVIVDDIQYFNEGLVQCLETLASRRAVEVFAAGRELDDFGKPFSQVARLMSIADEVEKLSIQCIPCARSNVYFETPIVKATRTVRLDNGSPIGPKTLTSPTDKFEAWCRYHHYRAMEGQIGEIEFRNKVMPKLKVITGCMWSGKTRKLIYELKRCSVAGLKVQAFKHHLDEDRFPGHSKELLSHSLQSYPAESVDRSEQIHLDLRDDTDVVGIDETHFFDEGIVNLVEDIANSGRLVIVAGLDMDFRAQPFGSMPLLIALADDLDKRKAVCRFDNTHHLTATATRTQRLEGGQPADWSSDVIMPIDEDESRGISHEPRCRHHHKVQTPSIAEFDG